MISPRSLNEGTENSLTASLSSETVSCAHSSTKHRALEGHCPSHSDHWTLKSPQFLGISSSSSPQHWLSAGPVASWPLGSLSLSSFPAPPHQAAERWKFQRDRQFPAPAWRWRTEGRKKSSKLWSRRILLTHGQFPGLCFLSWSSPPAHDPSHSLACCCPRP